MSTPVPKLTRRQRIQEKIAGGMTHLEAEIAIVTEENEAKLAELKRKKAREDARVNSLVLELLQSDHAEIFRSLSAAARAQIAGEALTRSERAKAGHQNASAAHSGGAPASSSSPYADQ